MRRKIRNINERVRLVSYNPEWPLACEREISLLKRTLGKQALGIEHHGSTAIPGLAAKPIVDILVGMKEPTLSERIRIKLRAIGYYYVGRRLGTERLYLIKRGKLDFNLAVVTFEGPLWNANLSVRDYLRNQPKKAYSYERKKRSLLAAGKKYLFEYSDGKAAFLEKLQSRAQRGRCNEISDQWRI